MKSRKGFTLIELLVIIAIIGILLTIVVGGIVGVVLVVKGIGAAGDAIDNVQLEYEQRMISNPPLYKVGDIVYHKASEKKLIVAKLSATWNDTKKGWNIWVKDGGKMDVVGGFVINETEVTAEPPA
jgi:prepilin-type N-terminal cleavage/methylation domain-containing protein